MDGCERELPLLEQARVEAHALRRRVEQILRRRACHIRKVLAPAEQCHIRKVLPRAEQGMGGGGGEPKG